MKAVLAAMVVAMVLAGGAFATGAALDPRVPGLQRQIRQTNARVTALQGQLGAKLDKSCIEIVPMVVRPGYVYQANDGSLIVYQAFDEYRQGVDTDPNMVMQMKAGC